MKIEIVAGNVIIIEVEGTNQSIRLADNGDGKLTMRCTERGTMRVSSRGTDGGLMPMGEAPSIVIEVTE